MLNGTVCTSAFGQGHALLRGCLWKRDSQLWGTTNVLTPGSSYQVIPIVVTLVSHYQTPTHGSNPVRFSADETIQEVEKGQWSLTIQKKMQYFQNL